MKKKFFVTAAIAALMGVGAYFGHATEAPTEGLSDLELANAEALADPEWWAGVEWATGCLSGGSELCVMGPYQKYEESTSVYN